MIFTQVESKVDVVCVSVCLTEIDRKCGDRQTTTRGKLTGTGDNRNVAQQAEDLWAEEGTVPNVEEFVEKNL